MSHLPQRSWVYIGITPLFTIISWLMSTHTWTHFINLFFTFSIIFAILLFTLLVIQEGILDVTSFGFRRFKYQLMRKKDKGRYESDDFFNPKQPKKKEYVVQSWIKPALYVHVFYIVLSFILAFTVQ
ncbi:MULTISPECIES: DUF3899 domain-containing protein [Staphylococcus]|uniref:DUF3899 domain-containing protein n=2 Tax=Staphylococcus agnetis TaxID=985762 RepID=A0A085UE52_9STAP|nr:MULTISPECIES: DUF3899 domain-containing protein [Staphylococcus]ALN75961.1 DUF3899 domain-containing protein [Staphylococcus agnetis]KFE41465.1 hypothetical protein SAGN_08078 [Staphylococcus agnetis]MBY7664760.1 DUF3899 domain-containing protein [Staphylococcus agnetis]MCO4339359.1 DUF3899 domain-containing protein [Staphylococcus agnetis]MCO4341612.1 DUF3899 domain-containing protein [Staphylococcus agnetis]